MELETLSLKLLLWLFVAISPYQAVTLCISFLRNCTSCALSRLSVIYEKSPRDGNFVFFEAGAMGTSKKSMSSTK